MSKYFSLKLLNKKIEMSKKIILFFLLLFYGQLSYANLPSSYYPNYETAENIESITENFSKLEAYKSTNEDVPIEIFSTLSKDFDEVFPYFPQTPNNRVVFEQCKITTNSLTSGYSYDKFLTFRTRCFQELNDIMKDVNNNYTMIANINANPKSGSAPLSVTFDARSSIDPSNDTIPDSNYYWYYKNTSGNEVIIGQGPVINHTFNREGNYIIHLTTKSVNRLSEGIFDGSATTSINVSPKSAVLSAYINGQKLDELSNAKIGVQEGNSGVIIDGSGTYPTGGRTIEKTTWEITGPNGFNETRGNRGSPSNFRISLPDKGEYTIRLEIQDNENNLIYEEYPLIVSDPVARIVANPKQGDSSTNFSFDASTSYSIESRIKNYKWTIFDPNGNQIDSFESKSFDRQFEKPGNYNIRLIAIDQNGNQNSETYKLNVKSTKPIPQFTINPIRNWDKPSQFLFDASSSYDIDEINGHTDIEYEWSFTNRGNVTKERSFEGGKRILISFEDKGEYDVTLTVKDGYGESNSIKKTINVESALRPSIIANPFATQIGETVNFSSDSNKTISYYEWDFGNGKILENQSNTISNIYNRTGIYNVALKVATPSGETNTVRRDVFVGQRGYPVGAYQVNSKNAILTQDGVCEVEEDGEIVKKPAFEIKRYQDITINTKDSINASGRSDNLKIDFRPKNDQTYQKNNFEYKFSEVGCSYIDLRVEDRTINKIDNKRIWFNVKNALPELDNITMTFPQYGNEVGVGFGQQQVQANIFEKKFDPLIVRVSAKGAEDPDGQISYFIRYYYDINNPRRILQVKTSPANVHSSVFSIPRMPGEFVFGVRIIDNNGSEIDSEDVIGKGPSVFFPPSTENPDIPEVGLSVSSDTVLVGEETRFEVNARILGNRDDFEANRTIRYDFDGDGIYDLTTKSDSVKHVYKKPGEYNPRVKVSYRGYAGVDNLERFEVLEGLTSSFAYDVAGKDVILKDASLGNIESIEFCMDLIECRKGNKDYILENQEVFHFKYEESGKKYISLNTTDKYGNKDEMRNTIDIKEEENDIYLLSIPNAESSGDKYNIDVGSSLNNTVDFFVKGKNLNNCYIDFDVSHDSNLDGQPDNDKDLECGKLGSKTYIPKADNSIARLYYENSQGKVSKDIIINFLDFNIDLPQDVIEMYNQLNGLISSLSSADQDIAYLRSLLINLRDNIVAGDGVDGLVLQIYDWFEQGVIIDQDKEDEILEIMDSLMNEGIQAAIGGNDYEIAKGNIILFTPNKRKPEVQEIFKNIESLDGDLEQVKSFLQEILDIFSQELEKGTIDNNDYNIVQSDICLILEYYDIKSTACGHEEEGVETIEDSEGGILGTLFSVMIYVLGGIVGLFIILVIIFAIKAKGQSGKYRDGEDEEIEEDYEEEDND
ncbi:PKD repeat [Candidatus Vampirococcus lugosii]|uniref:PKD repeat n=2 Tax=Candidatus Vampirococcus lugosii TaxID=2789015 RepID=A0ABS5QMU2_9BACT|nr:PKD repeat [Candidatus Vampirococcus lugosii]